MTTIFPTALTVKMLKTMNAMGIFKNDDIWFPTYYTYMTSWNYSDASEKLAKVCHTESRREGRGGGRGRGREGERQTDGQTDRQRQRQKQRQIERGRKRKSEWGY